MSVQEYTMTHDRTLLTTQKFIVIKFSMYYVDFYVVEAETANVAMFKARKLDSPFERLQTNINAYGEGMIALQYSTDYTRDYITGVFKQWFDKNIKEA